MSYLQLSSNSGLLFIIASNASMSSNVAVPKSSAKQNKYLNTNMIILHKVKNIEHAVKSENKLLH